MPGTLIVNARESFSTVIFMGSEPRMRFGTLEQDVSANGERKWTVSAAVTYTAEPGQRTQSDVLNVTVTGPAADPGLSIPTGSQIEFDALRVGVSAPEQREGSNRIVGGRAWFTARNVRAVNGRPVPGKGEG
jgi:hypothetical protein